MAAVNKQTTVTIVKPMASFFPAKSSVLEALDRGIGLEDCAV